MGRGLAAPAADHLAARANEPRGIRRGADLRRAAPRSAATESPSGGSALDGDPAAAAAAGRVSAAGVCREPAAESQAGGGVAAERRLSRDRPLALRADGALPGPG